jgi:hypothetical protein
MSRSSGGLADGGNHRFSSGGRVAIPDVKSTPAGRATRRAGCPGRSSLSRSGAVGAVGRGSAVDRTGRAGQRARELVGVYSGDRLEWRLNKGPERDPVGVQQ